MLNLAGVVINPTLAYTFTIFYVVGFGMARSALMTSAADLFQGKHVGSILLVIVFEGFAGGAIGAWLGGHLSQRPTGSQTASSNSLITHRPAAADLR